MNVCFIIVGNSIGEGEKNVKSEQQVLNFLNELLVKLSFFLGIIIAIGIIAIRPIAPSFIKVSKETAELIKICYVSCIFMYFNQQQLLNIHGVL